jgi:N,N'-diacetyllegionaminate synthase
MAPVFIIAEMAQSYEGSFEYARALVLAAADSGAQAVKFQIFDADELAVPGYKYYDLYKKLELPVRDWKALRDLAHSRGMQFMSDVFGLTSARMLAEEVKLDAFKVHAADIMNLPLIEYLARQGKRMYLSTGGSSEEELSHAIRIIRAAGNYDICLLHGYQASPTPIEESPLQRMETFRRRFDVLVGCQDHVDAEDDLAVYWPLVAVAAGADVIEKHLTLNRADKKEDYISALHVDEFARMVRLVRRTEAGLGANDWNVTPMEQAYRQEMTKRVVAARPLRVGQRLTAGDLTLKRHYQAGGFYDMLPLLGREIGRDCRANDLILEGMLVSHVPEPCVVAALACRASSTRLYNKPLQLIGGMPILTHLLERIRRVSEIQRVVLAIAEGDENLCFVKYAQAHDLDYVIGLEDDTQLRLLLAADKVHASHIFRVTTECPYIHTRNVSECFRLHFAEQADLTVCETLPEGTYSEIVSVEALRRAHEHSDRRHREFVTQYLMEHPEQFKLLRLKPEGHLQRPDIRLTVDYPEDLIVCRALYDALGADERIYDTAALIRHLDDHPQLKAVNGWIDSAPGRIWN